MHLDSLDDEEAIIEAAKCDIAYFKILYDQYYERIFSFIYRKLASEYRAADITSQTFLKAMNSLDSYEYRGVSFGAWLYRIANNEVNQFYRQVKRNQTMYLEEDSVIEFLNTDEHEDKTAVLSQLKKFLDQLSDEEIAILELRFFENKDFKEIAFVLERKESAVKMKAYRAIDKLRKMFKNARIDDL